MRMLKKSRSGIAFLAALSLAAGMFPADAKNLYAGEIFPAQESGAEVTAGDAQGRDEDAMEGSQEEEGTVGIPAAGWEMPAGTGAADAADFGEPLQEGREATAGGFSYVEREDGTLEVTNYTGNDTVIAIPDQINGKKVVSLGASFSKCRPLRAVALGANISSISPVPFSDSISLTYIAVDSRNPYFTSKDGILYNKGMTELIFCPMGREGNVEIPEGVTSIGKGAFLGCHLVTGVTLPEGLASIGESAFGNCISLPELTVPASVAELGNAVFFRVQQLKRSEACVWEVNRDCFLCVQRIGAGTDFHSGRGNLHWGFCLPVLWGFAGNNAAGRDRIHWRECFFGVRKPDRVSYPKERVRDWGTGFPGVQKPCGDCRGWGKPAVFLGAGDAV